MKLWNGERLLRGGSHQVEKVGMMLDLQERVKEMIVFRMDRWLGTAAAFDIK